MKSIVLPNMVCDINEKEPLMMLERFFSVECTDLVTIAEQQGQDSFMHYPNDDGGQILHGKLLNAEMLWGVLKRTNPSLLRVSVNVPISNAYRTGLEKLDPGKRLAPPVNAIFRPIELLLSSKFTS